MPRCSLVRASASDLGSVLPEGGVLSSCLLVSLVSYHQLVLRLLASNFVNFISSTYLLLRIRIVEVKIAMAIIKTKDYGAKWNSNRDLETLWRNRMDLVS